MAMQNFKDLAQKFQLFVAGQLDLRSNERSNLNFDCRYGFLGVDYIYLDTSFVPIKVGSPGGGRGGGSGPPGGVW